MAKKKRTQKRYKKSQPLTSDDIRRWGRRIQDIQRECMNCSADMDGAGIAEIKAIIQGLETHVTELEERVQVEFRNRVDSAIRKKAVQDAAEFS